MKGPKKNLDRSTGTAASTLATSFMTMQKKTEVELKVG